MFFFQASTNPINYISYISIMSVSIFDRAKRLPDLESINLNNLQGNVLETKYGQFRKLNTPISFRGEAAVRDTGHAYSRVPIANYGSHRLTSLVSV